MIYVLQDACKSSLIRALGLTFMFSCSYLHKIVIKTPHSIKSKFSKQGSEW